jgi:hypothetical protein
MNWLTISIAINVVLTLIVIAAIKWNIEFLSSSVKEELRLKEVVIIREQQLFAEKMRNLTTKTLIKPASLDETTSKLLALALNNTNENEARSAALQVCKRIKKSL